MENFGQTVDKVLYVNTFKALRQKYEQQQDRQKERSQAPLEKYVSFDIFMSLTFLDLLFQKKTDKKAKDIRKIAFMS